MSEIYKAYAANDELAELILSKAEHWAKRAERDRFDLFPFFCILTSTGWNKNTDIFDPCELWDARKSPVDKPVNIGHQATKICGHIVDSIVVGEDLQPIPDDTEKGDLPYKFHIVLACVIYKYFDDAKAQAEVDEVIKRITKGDIFCSMECLFKNFDFGLMDSKGEQKRIPRNSQTSGLTKYLRQYKGIGKIHNYTIGRILRDITFSAVGIVDKPANPDSIISASLDLFSTATAVDETNSVYINLDSINNREKTMSDTIDNTKFETLQAEFTTLAQTHELTIKDNQFLNEHIKATKLELDNANKALASSQEECKKMADEVQKEKADDEGETEMASLKSSIAKLEKKVEDLEKDKASLATANDAMDKTLEEFRKASRHSDRAEAMMNVDAKLTRESALQAVAKFDELSEAGFAGMLEMMKGYASKAPKEVTAETIINGAKAETDVPMGAAPESNFSKVTADIKNFITTKKGS